MKETSIILLSSLCTCVTSLSITRLTADNQNNTAAMTAAEASSSLEQSESHRRMKRWAQYGNKVWNDTIRIGYANYANTYSILDQDQILRECTQVCYTFYVWLLWSDIEQRHFSADKLTIRVVSSLKRSRQLERRKIKKFKTSCHFLACKAAIPLPPFSLHTALVVLMMIWLVYGSYIIK